MSTRICVYKDCHNFYSRLDNTACSDVTLFSFPKDPKRAEQWRLLGEVHPKISAKQLFMCSKHFDNKYLSITKNRTILLGQAVPNAYENTENPILDVDDLENVTLAAKAEDVRLKTETPQSFFIDMDDDQLSIENMVMIESTKANEKDNVKQFGVSIVTPSRKRTHSPTSPTDSLVDFVEEDDEQLIDPTEVSIFKLKSEEYVQMSRQYYLQEKRQMINQLRSYKQILSNLKTQLMSLEDI